MRFTELLVVGALLASAWCAITFFRFLASRVRHRGEQEARRFDLIAAALRDPSLDPTTRAELLRSVARERHGALGWIWQRVQNPALWRVLWFGSGWIGMVLSGTALSMAFAWRGAHHWNVEPLVMCTAFCFAMLTLPLALREVARREHAAARRG